MKIIKYIDLGLKSNIKWCDCYISKLYSFRDILNFPEEQYKCFREYLPTIDDFKELYDSCIIKNYKKGCYDFYVIIGPNGNKIRIVRGVRNIFFEAIETFVFVNLWLKDGFFEDKTKLPKCFAPGLLKYGFKPHDVVVSNSFSETAGHVIFVKR